MSVSRIVPVEELFDFTSFQSSRHHGQVERDIQSALQEKLEGEVRFDAGSKAMYAVDASNYRQVPIGIVVPRSKQDVVNTVSVCRQFGLPILSRGGGTSLAGECCNAAMVMDWSKYLRGVLEMNLEERYARVLPGTVCDELRDAAMQESGRKLTWGPDPATHNHCCFGGMIGNNSCGAHAQMSGKTDKNIEELEILLYDGTRMVVGWTTGAEMDAIIQRGGRTGEIYDKLRSLRDRYADLIRSRYPDIPRRVSGYNLDQLLPGKDGRFNIARALVGSEGTLVTVLEAKCRLIDARAERVIVALGYGDVYEAADHVVELDRFNPTALEGIDERLHQNIGKKGGAHRNYLHLLPEGKGWLMVELGADQREVALETAHELMNTLKAQPNAPSMKLFTDKTEMEQLWDVRESALGATAFVPGEPNTWPGWEDSAVAPERLGGYLRELRSLFDRYEYNPALYGHFGQGCVHCRVDFDLASEVGIRKYRSFMNEATDLCVKYGGSLSGEHGDGQARGEFLYKMFGQELIHAFREFKSIWDPDWKMNPGKVVDPYRIDQNLRLGADYNPWRPQTHFQFPDDEGSFAHAALRCVGIGKCRRESAKSADDDVMCPSYMVTREERHTTRGRARHLWEMLHGGVIDGRWRDESVKESLDLCLACKGCKGDCPVNVDMATYKAEFLSHYWEGRIRPRYAYAFGLVDQLSRLASIWPGLVNLVTQTPGLSQIAKLAAGMPLQRKIPQFAPETFQHRFHKLKRREDHPRGTVLLWPDTFNNYFYPETAGAAAEVLDDAGFNVEVPRQHVCCGRPLYDYGKLHLAKRYLRRIMQQFRPQIEAGMPFVILEPSCASVFRDELHSLFPQDPTAKKLREQTFLLSEFLEKKAQDYQLPTLRTRALVQGHCHHKSVLNFDDEKKVLKEIGLDAEILTSGCCGMAGSFGFEKDKYDVSIAIGERVLLPRVREASKSTVIIADGFSCREQIAQDTNRQALHLAEVIRLAGREGRSRSDEMPESAIVAARRSTLRKSQYQTLGILGAMAVATGLLTAYAKRLRD
jgi:FAD/FMN-containing dehydrogenase/Fe-S oxidoreductase